MKLKKILIILLSVLLLSGCVSKENYDSPETESADMSHYDISSQRFHVLDGTTFLQLIEDKKTFIMYVGYDECPWCQELVPILSEVCDNKKIDIYYYNYLLQREIDGNAGVQSIIDFCGENLPKDEDGNTALFMPSVIYILNGEYFDIHMGTVSSHDPSVAPMTAKQQSRLEYMLNKEFNSLLSGE